MKKFYQIGETKEDKLVTFLLGTCCRPLRTIIHIFFNWESHFLNPYLKNFLSPKSPIPENLQSYSSNLKMPPHPEANHH